MNKGILIIGATVLIIIGLGTHAAGIHNSLSENALALMWITASIKE